MNSILIILTNYILNGIFLNVSFKAELNQIFFGSISNFIFPKLKFFCILMIEISIAIQQAR